jgi:dsRNA-specific ribonuclease
MKSFEVVAVIGDKRYAIGKGTAKKEAEQEAARITLTMLDDDENEEEKED